MVAFDRITFDNDILGGRACIRGMRISVALIMNQLANGLSVDQLLAEYPTLERDDVRAAMKYAAWLSGESNWTA